MITADFFRTPATEALGWTLLHALWQGFALALPAAVLLHLLRHRSSALRYRLGLSALLAQLLLSAVTFAWYYAPAATTPAVSLTAQPAMPLPVAATLTSPAWSAQCWLFLYAHLNELVLAYLIGLSLAGLRLAGGWFYLQRVSRQARPARSALYGDLTDRLRATLQIRAVVRVRESAQVVVPMVVGVLKPLLLVPAGLATGLTQRELEAVLAHELAHVKRHDYAINLLQAVIDTLYFFHPALGWLSARVREERELCCDDLAIAACGGNGHLLAQALARVESFRVAQAGPTPTLAMALFSRRLPLLHRVQRMLGVPTRSAVSNGSLAGLTLATLLLVSASVYAVQQPASKASKIRKTRYTLPDNSIEFQFDEARRLTAVTWQKQKLAKPEVARLQQQLDNIMSGTLSLDAVGQPNRDMLLAIIESYNSMDERTAADLDEPDSELATADYRDLVASALTNIPLSPDGTVEGLAKVNYDSIVQGAMASLGGLTPSSDSLLRIRAYHHRQLDSLTRLINQHSQRMQSLHRQMQKLQFPIDAEQRSQDAYNWQRDKLMAQRDALIARHSQLLQRADKKKMTPAELDRQLNALQPEIERIEKQAEAIDKQAEATRQRAEALPAPLDKRQAETTAIADQLNQLSTQMGQHADLIETLTPELPERPELPEQPELPEAIERPDTPARVRELRGSVTRPARVRGLATPAPRPKPAPRPRPVPAPAPAPAPAPMPRR